MNRKPDFTRAERAALGLLPCISPSKLAQAIGVSRQAIESRMRRGTLRTITLPYGTKVIAIEDLAAFEQAMLATVTPKEKK